MVYKTITVDTNLLSARELELGSPECLNDVSLGTHAGTDRQDHLTDLHTSHSTLGLAKSSSHSSLEPRTMHNVIAA